MRIGDRVTYVESKTKRHPATVTAIVGAGASNWKRLDLSYAGKTPTELLTAADVAHAGDQAEGEGYWLLATETEEPPERRAEPEKQPITMAIAQEIGALPDSDRRASEETG